jgi:pimeloyl-ACP methyl ester carboxylesterase
MSIRQVLLTTLLAQASASATPGLSVAQALHRSPDPVIADPTSVDSAYPPSTEELEFESAGARLNGFLYLADGAQPHPTVILLHGLPGNERNLDLAQVLRRAGMNVLFFSYRGAWGSGGTFSYAHALEDVAAAVQFVRSDSSIKAYRIDPHRVVLVGHSMGGWLALMDAASDTSVTCAIALDFANMGAWGQNMRTNHNLDSLFTGYEDWLTVPGGPLHADNGRVLTTELEDHADTWDLDTKALELRRRPLLIISRTSNDDHPPLIAALHAARAEDVTALQWRTDHGFSGQRIKLAHSVLAWLHGHCGT